mmetsp:Transcript_12511/g.36240  ORF Transcript_12511/g.36240 Transcript_12511/m.36240 type:complete len:335 (-) Transcript_12511:553-1557(-)
MHTRPSDDPVASTPACAGCHCRAVRHAVSRDPTRQVSGEMSRGDMVARAVLLLLPPPPSPPPPPLGRSRREESKPTIRSLPSAQMNASAVLVIEPFGLQRGWGAHARLRTTPPWCRMQVSSSAPFSESLQSWIRFSPGAGIPAVSRIWRPADPRGFPFPSSARSRGPPATANNTSPGCVCTRSRARASMPQFRNVAGSPGRPVAAVDAVAEHNRDTGEGANSGAPPGKARCTGSWLAAMGTLADVRSSHASTLSSTAVQSQGQSTRPEVLDPCAPCDGWYCMRKFGGFGGRAPGRSGRTFLDAVLGLFCLSRSSASCISCFSFRRWHTLSLIWY